MYGQTEASPRISFSSLFNSKQNINSIGKPVKGGMLYLKDLKGNIIKKPYTPGHLFYKGKNVMLGYARTQKDLLIKRKNKFVLNTNDIAQKDSLNNFYILGRADKFVKINSIKVNLQDFENYIESFCGRVACIEKNNNIFIFTEKLKFNKDLLKIKISKYSNFNKNLFKIINLKKIPITENNKINYFKLRSDLNILKVYPCHHHPYKI